MTSRRMIGAAALSLLVATPAAAMAQGHQHRNGYARQVSPVLGARGFTYRSVYGAYALDKSDAGSANTSDDFARRNTFN